MKTFEVGDEVWVYNSGIAPVMGTVKSITLFESKPYYTVHVVVDVEIIEEIHIHPMLPQNMLFTTCEEA